MKRIGLIPSIIGIAFLLGNKDRDRISKNNKSARVIETVNIGDPCWTGLLQLRTYFLRL